MDCKTIINELLTAYMDGETTSEECVQIESRLSTCEKCREELRVLQATRDELRQALRLKAEEVKPPSRVWNSISQRISEPSIWSRLISLFNKPVWRTAIPVILVLIVIGALWRTGVLPGLKDSAPFPTPSITTITQPPASIMPMPTTGKTRPTTTTTRGPAPTTTIPTLTPGLTPPPITFTIVQPMPDLHVGGNPNVAYTLPGQPVGIELTFANISSEPITLNVFPAGININHPGSIQTVRSFAAGNTQLNLTQGEKIIQTLHWDGRDNSGKQVSPGWYVVNVETIYIHETPPVITSQGFGDVARIYVQYPQGTMQNIFALNLSKTVNSITMTLERIELTATGMKVYALIVPPGYNLPAGQPGPAPSFWVHAEAEYSIDSGDVKQAGLSGIRFLESGVTHIWDNLDPLPSDAKELTFRITKLGEWEGPWEFRIQLQ